MGTVVGRRTVGQVLNDPEWTWLPPGPGLLAQVVALARRPLNRAERRARFQQVPREVRMLRRKAQHPWRRPRIGI